MEETTKFILKSIQKQWIVIIPGIGLLTTSLYLRQVPKYSHQELETILILMGLFMTVKGLYNSGIILKIARRLEQGGFIPLKLTLITFLLSMIVTNDVALIAVIPLTLSLNINRKDLLVILEALSANAGSALTPFGNPQNLFIYYLYRTGTLKFIKTIAPLSVISLIILSICSVFIKVKQDSTAIPLQPALSYKAYVFSFLTLLIILVVIYHLPTVTVIPVILISAICDQESIKIDYSLLLCFLLFFGFTNNIKTILSSRITSTEHVFLISTLMSQVISNVPTAIMLSKFTPNWKALLWGTNVGGFGSIVASLSNLIAYRLYINYKNSETKSFITKMLIANYTMFIILTGIHFIITQAQRW